MKIRHINILSLLLLLLFPHPSYSGEQEALQTDWKLNQIQITPSGFMKRSGGDPYIIFPEMETTNHHISGVQLEITFSPMPAKPFLMELFWRPDYEEFGEHRKVFFVLLPPKAGDTIKFYIPLNTQDGYKQFRLDFPGDLTTSFQVKSFDTIIHQQITDGVVQIEPFYKLDTAEASTPGVVIPYILHAIQHGLSRLLKDPVFLFAWLFLIFAALFGTRIVSRSIRKQQLESQANDSGE